MISVDIGKSLFGGGGNFELRFKAIFNKGEIVTIYGPSGSGKSSILRMLAGLMQPDVGRILARDEIWFDKNENIDIVPQKRNIGMVFQEYALFPNMTVRENLLFALQKNQETNFVDELLDISEMTKLQHKKPSILSGGQKQRISLIRAMVRKPDFLFLDEPLSALDAAMRSKLQDYILEFHKRYKLTTILVSHDYPEVIKMSNRIILLESGEIKAEIFPDDLKNF